MHDVIFSDAAIRSAAARVRDSLLKTLPPPSECDHVFSESFSERMSLLIRKHQRKAFANRMLRWVASIALAILIAGSAWIAVDAEARAAVVGWVTEIYETYFVFQHDGTTDEVPEFVDYRPTWIPDGYSEFRVKVSETRTVVIYTSDSGDIIRFNYIHNPDETDWFIDVSQADVKSATVNGNKADLLIAQNPDEANGIAWVSADTAFYISGFVDETDLVKMAESVHTMK